jgi:hypothetical protein
MFSSLLFLYYALGIPLTFAVDPLRVHHRVYHPNHPQAPFAQRGTILFSSGSASATFEPSESLIGDLAAFADVVRTVDGTLYQIALEREGDLGDGHWDISSVKVCHLPKISSESIILHVTSSGKPYALDYFVSPVPHDGSCPKGRRTSSSLFPSTFNTTVSIHSPRLPPLPELRVPPPLSPEGAPIQPIPEKTFLQKYWMYIGAILIALVMTGGGPEEEVPKRGGGGDSQ